MNRLEKLKEKLCDKHLDCFDLAPPTAGLSFCQGWNAASSEYEKIIAELEGALKFYADHKNYSLFGLINDNETFQGKINLQTGEGFEEASKCQGKNAKQALQKLKEFMGGE